MIEGDTPLTAPPAAPRRFRFDEQGPGGIEGWTGCVWSDGSATARHAKSGIIQHAPSMGELRRYFQLASEAIEWLDDYVPASQIVPAGEPQVIGHICRAEALKAVEEFRGLKTDNAAELMGELEILVHEACQRTAKALLRAQGIE